MPALVASLVVTGFVAGADKMISASARIVSTLTTATNTIQKMESTLIASSGSLAAARTDLESIREITDRLGTSFEGTVVPFAKFAASATKFKKEEYFRMFEDVSTALSAIHAPANTVSGAFLALQQIVSKGKLSMQDLRRQFAEHIPGAMAAAVKAFGDGTASYSEFEKAVASGDVVLSSFLPKFTELLEASAAQGAARAAQTLSAEIQRTTTAYTFFLEKITETSDATETWKEVLVVLQEGVLNNEDAVKLFSDALALTNVGVSTLVHGISSAIPYVLQFTETFKDTATAVTKTKIAYVDFLADIVKFYAGTIEAKEVWESLKEALADTIGYETAADKIVKLNEDQLNSVKALREGAEEYGLYAQQAHEDEINNLDKLAQAREDANAKYVTDTEAVFKETGLMRQEYFDNEVALLQEKAQKWKEVGVSIVDSETWLENSIVTLQNKINDAVDETATKRQDAAEASAKVVEEMYKATGKMSQEYFDNEVRLLQEKAQKWSEAGLDIVSTETWLANSISALQSKINTSVDKTITKYKDLETQIKATLEWNELADKEAAASGVSVSLGGDEARWDESSGNWRTQSSSASYLSEDKAGSTTINNFSQQLSKSDVSNIIIDQQRVASRI